jgi:hypothetical protein
MRTSPTAESPFRERNLTAILPIELILGFDIDRKSRMAYLPCMCHPENSDHTPATLDRNLIVAVKLHGLDAFGPALGQGSAWAR